MYQLEEETAVDEPEVEALYDLCFAPGRRALSSYRFRNGVRKVGPLCLTLREDGVLAAVIRYWPVQVDARQALLLGPLAVHPTRQGEGLGGLLMRESLAEARRLDWERVMLVGDLPYYRRFGFRKIGGVIMPAPTNPERILALDLAPGAWEGVKGEVKKATERAEG